MKTHPPLIAQFIQHQEQYPDGIIATEVGGFFEIWEVDGIGHARKASSMLDTVLTRRNKADLNSPYMTGFPSHAAENYFNRLVELGETVIVVEQSIRGSKSDNNKQVERGISRILSPGTTIDGLESDKNNYFASIYKDHAGCGIALCDVSTGEIKILDINEEEVPDFIGKIAPKEVLVTGIDFPGLSNTRIVKTMGAANALIEHIYSLNNINNDEHYGIKFFNLELWRNGVMALGNLFNHFSSNNYTKNLLRKIGEPKIYNALEHMRIPLNGYLSLEIFENVSKNKTTLYNTLNDSKTPMGKRLLRNWLLAPSNNKKVIEKRLDRVEYMLNNNIQYPRLEMIGDIAKMSRKMVLGRLEPVEFLNFNNSLILISEVLDAEGKISKINDILSFIKKNIDIDNITVNDYNFLKYSKGIAALYLDWKKSESELNEIKEKLEAILKTDKLRLVQKSDCFYLVGPKGIAARAKEDGIAFELAANDCKITDSRFMEPSRICFSKMEEFVSEAKKEWANFQQKFTALYGLDIISLSEMIAEIDVLSSFARISKDRGYYKPKIIDGIGFNFKNMRHPVVEIGNRYIANDVSLVKNDTLVIYGANSSGKSTILRGIALNIIMAQIGCFIPCIGELSVFDAILTRMSSFDAVSEGLSTFTMEMKELQSALRYAGDNSLFLFDEIGRGTSVEDGEAIAFAVLNYLNNKNFNCITLFATHYHKLYDSIKDMVIVKNLKCENDGGKIKFSRKLEDGPGDGSYGIEVARSCGLPEGLINAAVRYRKEYAEVKRSRYNSNLYGILCDECGENEAQETHHEVEQKQGKVRTFEINGGIRSINERENLRMLCSTCHERITRGSLTG